MSALWRRTAARFDALSLRERIMVTAAVLVAILALAYTLMIDPELQKQKRSAAAMLQKQSEMRALDAQVQALLGSRAQDPDRQRREKLAQLHGRLNELDGRIRAEERRFTQPAQMRGVIENVLGRARGIELVEMKTLPVSTLAPSDAKGADARAADPKAADSRDRLIYRHGLEVTVSGSYLDLLAYLRDLEALPTQLYWGGLSLDASKYPKVLMKLTVYTLSLDRAWLNV